VPHADDVFLLIEVADTTLAYDRSRKLKLYAKEGIVEYWIVNVSKKCIEVYRDRKTNGYATSVELLPGDVASPLALPDINLFMTEIFA
jgi:Uma2 family endonuclease